MTQDGAPSDEDGRCGGRGGEWRAICLRVTPGRQMYGVGCVVHRLGAGVFRIQRSLIYFVSSWSAGLNRPVAAMRRNVMSLYYLRRRESVFRRGKTKRFDEPSQAIAGQDDIPRLFSRSPRVFAEAIGKKVAEYHLDLQLL